MHRTFFGSIIIAFCLLVVFSIQPMAADNNRVNINGNVNYHGLPVCAMVLANGQFAFTCSGDGSFSFDVPLDSNGQITVQTFCAGREPHRQTVNPAQATGMSIDLQDSGSEKNLDVNATLHAKNTSRCVISGTVAYNGAPVCAMVLANGQYAFTCSGDGSFNLDVPLDGGGQVTLFTFCAGTQPYMHLFSSGQISFVEDSDGDGITILAGDCNDLNPGIHPGAIEICGDGVDQNCSGQDAACVDETVARFYADGTYSYNGEEVTFYFSTTTFPSDNGPTPYTQLFLPVLSISETSLAMINENGDLMNWTREQGQRGSIPGRWTYYENDLDRLEMQIRSDGTVTITGYFPLSAIYTSSGTYTHSGDRLTLKFVMSDFIDGPYPGMMIQVQIVSITQTALHLIADENELEIWQRWQGDIGNIQGFWVFYETDGTAMTIDLKSDGTFIYIEYRE